MPASWFRRGGAERAAPAASRGAIRQPPPSARYGWLWSAIWLVYLASPIQKAWQRPELWQRALGLSALGLFAVLYLGTFFHVRGRFRRPGADGSSMPPRTGAAVVAAMAVLICTIIVALGGGGFGCLVYFAVTATFVLPARAAWAVTALAAAVPVTAHRLAPDWKVDPSLSLLIPTTALLVWGFQHILARNAQLAAAQGEIARLAVADERARFARDLHDLLGHSLTVVAVKAELAGRLIAIAPDRAQAEIADVERLAREALHDVRAAVGGYREVSLATELASARTALDAAGIEADLPVAVDDVPAQRRDLFAWVIREGVTNVVRHSEAKRCTIRVNDDSIEVTDDGRGPAADGPAPVQGGQIGGHGLTGLRERVEAAGGVLEVGSAPGGGFALTVRVP